MSIISLKNLNKFVGDGENRQQIIKNISFSVDEGEYVAIIGQSGSGKSTLMNIIGCLDEPTSGEYIVNGAAATLMNGNELAELRSKTFGFIFQRYNLLGSLPAVENVALPAVYAGMQKESRLKRAGELLCSLGLKYKLYNKPNQLSGGQQQRVSIARALMNGGKIILADEPTGALDSASGKLVLDILEDLHAEGHTIILVTHDPLVAARAERIIELKDGEIISEKLSVLKERSTEGKSQSFELKNHCALGRLALRRDRIAECFRMAVQSVYAHKLRSALTMLGIIIGIAAVIFVVALGRGSQKRILEDIGKLGTNTINIFPGTGWGDMYSNKLKTLTVEDVNALSSQTYLRGATPQVDASGTVVYGNIAIRGRVNGVNEQGFGIEGKVLIAGRFYTALETAYMASVTVIDEDARDILFSNGESPLGKYVFFEQRPLQVIGVIKRTSAEPNNSSVRLWSPYTTVMRKISGVRTLDYITVQVADGISSQVAEKNIETFMTARRGKRDFFMYNIDTYQKAAESAARTTALLISALASVSLVVGGIGVMNIMLVSVTERTAEVGLRMAIGARRSSVLLQFLTEAVALCLLGGSIGIIVAFAAGGLFNYFSSDLTLVYSPDTILLALGCSSAVGIIFGFIPARNASLLSPIQALARD